MLKKVTALMLSICMVLGMTACAKKDKNSLTNSYSQIMLVMPESVELENGFLDDYENVKKVVLPKDYDKNIDKIIEDISSFAENKKVKSIIICSDKEGLLPVFEKIKKKNEALITVAAGIEEMQNEEIKNEVEMNEFITMGFNPNDIDNNENAVKMAKAMGAKVFVNYVDEFSKNSIEYQAINKEIQGECNRNNLKYIEVEIPNMKNKDDYKTAEKFIRKDAANKKKIYGENVSLYGSIAAMDRGNIIAAIENGLMVPSVHSLDSARLYSDILKINIDKEDENNYKKINSMISKKVKELNMEGRLAGTEIPEKTFCVEVAVKTVNKIFTKKGDEYNVFKEIQKSIKEEMGILAEYKKIRYDSNFFRMVEMYPILY